MVDKRDLKNLPPEERIKALKKIEEQRRKEIMEAEKLIRESEEQIEGEKETLRKIPIPQLRSVDISTLFSNQEKALFETHHQTKIPSKEPEPITTSAGSAPKKNESTDSLEEALGASPNKQDPQAMGMRYGKPLEESLGMIYKSLNQISEKVEDKGYMNSAEQKTVDFYKAKIEEIHDSLGVHPEHGPTGMLGMIYGGLEKISDIESKAGYARGGHGPGHSKPNYKL